VSNGEKKNEERGRGGRQVPVPYLLPGFLIPIDFLRIQITAPIQRCKKNTDLESELFILPELQLYSFLFFVQFST